MQLIVRLAMSIKSAVAALAVIPLLGACSGNLVHLQTDYNASAYDYANFALYHADRDTQVDVHGNPFGMDATAFAAAVTDRMQGANPGRRTNFTPTPGASAEKNLHVVMAFDTDSDGYDLCNGKIASHKPGTDVLTLRAAWCFSGRQDSMVEATVGRPKDVNDPRFRDLIQQTVLNLFPLYKDRELIRDNDDSDRRH